MRHSSFAQMVRVCRVGSAYQDLFAHMVDVCRVRSVCHGSFAHPAGVIALQADFGGTDTTVKCSRTGHAASSAIVFVEGYNLIFLGKPPYLRNSSANLTKNVPSAAIYCSYCH